MIAMDGSLVGRSFAVIGPFDVPALLLQRVARLRARAMAQSYLRASVCSSRFTEHCDAVKTTTAIPHISPLDIRAFVVAIPPGIAEQQAIAEALSDADALIESLQQLIAKQRAIKQGAMQALLTGRQRLPGFSGDWQIRRLGDICQLSMGRTPPRADSGSWGGANVWLAIADLDRKVVATSKERITDKAASAMVPVKQGTLLMSFKLTIGRLCFAGCDLYTNEAICAFNGLTTDEGYLYYALSRVDFSLYGKQAVKGYTLNRESLAAVQVRMPSSDEQSAIAALLSDMDAAIDALEARLAKTRALKAGMMQQLLTGRIRLRDHTP